MIKEVCDNIIQNKNTLMFLTVGVYILALFAYLSGNVLIISGILTILLVWLGIKNYFPLKYIIIWSLIFYFGIINTSFRAKDVDELLSLAPNNSEITGTIVSIPKGADEGKYKFFLKVDSIKLDTGDSINLDEKVLVTFSPQNNLINPNLKVYDSYIFKGRLSQPFKAGNPSQFDYGNYLKNYNTYAVFYAKEAEKLNREVSFKGKVLQSINNYRENVLQIHSQYLLSPNLEILGGIVFGDDAVSPPKNIKQSFVNSGLLHILAASGMNVAFIYTFFFLIMSTLRVPFRVSVISSMFMVLIYTFMTGLGASVVRATLMLFFVLIGKLIDRDAHSISLLSFVALLMLIYNPMLINDVGFQLSFIVTFGLLLMVPVLAHSKNKIINFAISTVMIPIIAQLWVIPIQIFYFNNISVYSVFANIMSVPILMILSFGGFISSLLSAITPIANFICKAFDYILNPLLTLLINISDFWGNLPFSTFQTTHPSVFQILLYYGILICLVVLFYKEFREKFLKRILFSTLGLLFILLITLIPVKNSNLEIITFDVGNADCFLIKTPNNKYLMIDTGKNGYNGGKSQAEIIVLKYLKDKGIKNINSIIVSHFDNDHCGGVVDIINGVKVDNLYVNDLTHDSLAARDIYKASTINNVKLHQAKQGDVVYNEDGLQVINFLPVKSANDNDNSIISVLKYNDFSMLFTGDAGISAITSIKQLLPQNISVLKVPHHGASGGINSKLVKYLSPQYSIISVGENKFGHPDNLTLNLLKKSNILRTDINNSIKIDVKNDSYSIFTYNNRKRRYIKISKYANQ